jgi:hypothetical protein
MPTVPQEVHFGAPWTDPVTGTTWYPTARPHLIRDQGLLDRIVASGQHYVTAAFDPASPGALGGSNPGPGAFSDLTSLGNVTALQMRAFNSGAGQFSITGLDVRGPSSLGNQGGVLIGISPRDAGLTRGSLLIGQQSATGTYVNTMAEFDMHLQRWSFVTSGVERLYMDGAGSVVVGAPGGGGQGAGTVSATGFYDDGALLSCYVFQAALGQTIDFSFWDDQAPDREWPAVVTLEREPTGVMDANGDPVMRTVERIIEPARTEARQHEGARKFAARLGTEYDPLDLDKYAAHWREKAHLTSMPNKTGYDPLRGLSAGEWVQRLVETAEIQAVHIEALNQRTKDQAAEITAQAALIADLTARLEALEVAAN